MNNIPDVSIIVPVYNRVNFVKLCINSVLEQSYTNWELLLIDDGSDLCTVEVLKKYSEEDSRIHFISRKGILKGPQICRNIGLAKAVGEYIIFLDSDDLLAPFCLKQRLSELTGRPFLDFIVYPQLIFYNEVGDSSTLINIKTAEPDLIRFFSLCYCLDVPWINTAPIFRRASLNLHTINWDEEIKGFQDVAFHLKCIIAGLNFEYSSLAPDFYYRMHEEDRIGKDIFAGVTLKSTEKMIVGFYLEIKAKGMLTRPLSRRISRTCFHALIEKWIALNNKRAAYNSLKIIQEAGIISTIVYKELRIYIYLRTSFNKRFNALINRVFYPLWRNNYFYQTAHHYLREQYKPAN